MFIILPVGMNYQTTRLPVVTFALMGVNVLRPSNDSNGKAAKEIQTEQTGQPNRLFLMV